MTIGYLKRMVDKFVHEGGFVKDGQISRVVLDAFIKFLEAHES